MEEGTVIKNRKETEEKNKQQQRVDIEENTNDDGGNDYQHNHEFNIKIICILPLIRWDSLKKCFCHRPRTLKIIEIRELMAMRIIMSQNQQ